MRVLKTNRLCRDVNENLIIIFYFDVAVVVVACFSFLLSFIHTKRLLILVCYSFLTVSSVSLLRELGASYDPRFSTNCSVTRDPFT